MKFASESFKSLQRAQKYKQIQIIIYDESPFAWKSRVQELYAGKNVELIHGTEQKGSAAALFHLADYALKLGYKFGYIHLDDHVYIEHFEKLVTASEEFMLKNSDTKWLRFSGYPLIVNSKKPLFKIEESKVSFCGLDFDKREYKNNNFWTSPISKSLRKRETSYWTIALWHCLFDLEFLHDMLNIGLQPTYNLDFLKLYLRRRKVHLAHIELFFRSKGYYEKLLNSYPSSHFGYCNFQFVGFEMHRNSNWKVLIGERNEKI